MAVVSLEKSNTGRQTEFDLLKVILIIGMVFVHVYEKLSIYDTSVLPGTTAEWVLQVGGGLVGASLFMFCMGIGMAYTPGKRRPLSPIAAGICCFTVICSISCARAYPY